MNQVVGMSQRDSKLFPIMIGNTEISNFRKNTSGPHSGSNQPSRKGWLAWKLTWILNNKRNFQENQHTSNLGWGKCSLSAKVLNIFHYPLGKKGQSTKDTLAGLIVVSSCFLCFVLNHVNTRVSIKVKTWQSWNKQPSYKSKRQSTTREQL